MVLQTRGPAARAQAPDGADRRARVGLDEPGRACLYEVGAHELGNGVGRRAARDRATSPRRSAAWSRSSDVSIDVAPRSIVSIIGPNGAGKTTFFNMLTGLYKPTPGRIMFDGKDVTGTRARTSSRRSGWRARSRTSACSRPMSALENVMVGAARAHERRGCSARSCARPACGARRARCATRRARCSTTSGLEDELTSTRSPRNLSYGDQRRVEIARALASDPQAAAARRANGRHEPAGVGAADGVHGAAARASAT